MLRLHIIGFSLLLGSFSALPGFAQKTPIDLEFLGETVSLPGNYKAPTFSRTLSKEAISDYLTALDTTALRPYLEALQQYRIKQDPGDWLYYQLVRRVAQIISPKADDYFRYTFYKWWFLVQSGYDARLAICDTMVLFYVQSNENVYNIPYRVMNGRQYVCLNYHDYGAIDFDRYHFTDATPLALQEAKPFSYKVTHIPDMGQNNYAEKNIEYNDGINYYSFHIKVNPQIKTLFSNYPVVDYDLQFNMPLSKTTYESLIPVLRRQLKGLKAKDGVEFLLHFTRYAFLFKPDTEVFGSEKRLTPEQTLLYDASDCEDHAAFFFFLVKEFYNLPMLVITYPQHVTVAVQFDKPYGNTIEFNGSKYSICEPTPQKMDFRIGQTLPELRKQTYQIAYAYQPAARN